MNFLGGKKILLGISGGIAAYKTPLLVRELIKNGAEVRVVITPSAKDFVTPLTLSTLSKNPVLSTFTANDFDNPIWNDHVELGLWADILLIAPATSNTISAMSNGRCNNLLLAVYLSAKCPTFIAPSMDLDMYAHPSNQKNISILKSYGNHIFPVDEGQLASGLVGKGRMIEPKEIVKNIREDNTEIEVAIAARDRMEREIVKSYPGAEYMDTWVWFQSGINTDGAHNPKTNRKLVKGDILSLNTFPMISGYYTALERTLFLDHADDASLKAWEANVKVHKRGLELIKPGVKCSDICHELNELFAELGYLQYRTFGYGHSFGMLSHFYGREAGLELREDIDTVLEENMVVSMEPMIMIPEGNPGAGGYREHDILVIGKDGVENITKFPFGPEHNIIKN